MAINQPGNISKCNFKGQIWQESLLKVPPAPFHFHILVNIPRIFQILVVEIAGPNWRCFCRSSQCACGPIETWLPVEGLEGHEGSVCAVRGFISSKHLQDFRFGIVRPIPEFHRKRGIKSRIKTPKSISFLAGRITGSIEILTARCSLSERRRVYKKWCRRRSASKRATGGSNGLERSATSRDFINRVSVWTCFYIVWGFSSLHFR